MSPHLANAQEKHRRAPKGREQGQTLDARLARESKEMRVANEAFRERQMEDRMRSEAHLAEIRKVLEMARMIPVADMGQGRRVTESEEDDEAEDSDIEMEDMDEE